MKRQHILLPVVLILLLLSQLTFGALPRYEIIDLGTLGGYSSKAHAINDAGQVVGELYTTNLEVRAFLWDSNAGMIDLGTLGNRQSSAHGINNNGKVVGSLFLAGGQSRAFIWDSTGGMVELGKGVASSINNAGQIAGQFPTVYDPDFHFYRSHACIWEDINEMIDLGTLESPCSSPFPFPQCFDHSHAYCINDAGQVVGYSSTSSGEKHAFLWDSISGMRDLGTLGGKYCAALSINNFGQIVGNSRGVDGGMHAFLWDITNGMRDLGTLGGNISEAYAINNARQVVGVGEDGACLWDSKNGMVPLDELLSADCELIELRPQAINNRGQIAGYGITDVGAPHAFLMTPLPKILYVDDDGPADFNNIQAAIDDAYDGDTIIVADGTYTGFGNRDIDFLGKAIIVRSENGPEHCIIDCNGTDEEPHRGFYFHLGEDSNSVLSGLTITNGYIYKGGGIYCLSSHPTITNCTFRDNTAQYYVQGAPFSTLPQNENSRSMVNNDGEVHINVPPGWEGYGGGIYCRLSSPILTNCTFTSNTSSPFGGAMYNSSSNPSLFNCIFNCNSASFGGGILNNPGSPRLFNCIFSGNSANYGGGMNNSGNSRPVITNCTFSGNTAKYKGGGIHSTPRTQPTFKNCIVWGNEVETALEIWGSATVSYSNVEGGWPGEGNFEADPCFVDPGYWDANGLWVEGDYHLQPYSVCIDAGDPNYVPEPNETDLDGRPRIFGGRIDMGAYEYMPSIPAEARIIPRTINLASKGNWITCYIWLPEQYNVADIEPNSVFLEQHIKSEQLSVDEQKQVAIARFSREGLRGIINTGEVDLTINGRLTDGTVFEAKDVIKVINEGRRKN